MYFFCCINTIGLTFYFSPVFRNLKKKELLNMKIKVLKVTHNSNLQ